MAQHFLDQFRPTANYIIDTNTMAWVPQTAASAGGGGPVSIADGEDTAEGTTTDVAWSGVGNGTVVSILKYIALNGASGGLTNAQLRATAVPVSIQGTVQLTPNGDVPFATELLGSDGTTIITNTGSSLNVNVTNSVDVTGTVATTNAGLTALATTIVAQGTTAPTKVIVVAGKTNDGTPQYREIPEGAGGRSVIIEGVALGTAVPVSGTFFQGTQPVSLASAPTTPVTNAGLTNLDVALSTRTKPADQQHAIIDSGTVTTVSTVTNLSQMAGAAISMGTGTRGAGVQRVTIATDDVVPVTGTFFQGTQPVSIASMPSTPVTGTFFQATQPVSGTVTTTPPSNASTNIAQINAVTPLMGNGGTGTGSLRVTVASDNTAFAVNAAATLAAETTKVIGTVNVAASQTIAVTQATGTSLHAVLDNGSVVAATLAAETTKVIGTVNVAASQTIAVTQATGSSLHAVLDTGSTTAVTQATGSNLHTVVDSGTITTVSTVTAVTSITNPVSTKTDLTPSAPAVASVGVSSASAVGAQATRKGLLLRNLSTTGQRISLGFGQTAVLDSGITLFPQDAWSMDEYSFDLGAVNAIASAASASLAIQEWLV